MAHESFFFIALTAGYITILFFQDRIVRWDIFRLGITAYLATIGVIAASTIARSIAAADGNPIQVEIWFSGFSWIAAGLSALLLINSMMRKK